MRREERGRRPRDPRPARDFNPSCNSVRPAMAEATADHRINSGLLHNRSSTCCIAELTAPERLQCVDLDCRNPTCNPDRPVETQLVKPTAVGTPEAPEYRLPRHRETILTYYTASV